MKKIKGTGLLIVSMFLFSFIGVFSRLSGKDPFSVSFYRAIFSMAIFFGLYCLQKGEIKNLRLTRDRAKVIIPYGLSVGITILAFICGYSYTTMSNTILLHYLMPVYVFLGSFSVTGERIRPRSIFGFLFALIGVALITGFDLVKGMSGRVLLGDFLAFISGISYAGIILWTRKARLMEVDIIYFVFWGWTITAIFCLPFVLSFGNLSLSFYSLLALLGLAIFSTVLPFIISNLAIKDLTAQASSIIAYSEAVFVMVWGTLIYKEAMTAVTMLGAGLIFFSLVVMVQGETKRLDITE